MIDPDHLPLALSLTIYKIADIKIPILINLYPNPIPLIQHQLALVNLSLRADDDSLAVSLAVDYGADVELVLVDGYPRAAEVFQVGKGSGVEGQGLETYEVIWDIFMREIDQFCELSLFFGDLGTELL